MRIIDDRDKEWRDAKRWMDEAARLARASLCRDARCGAVIVADGEAIGEGSNGPPGGREDGRRCHIPKTAYHVRVTDKTCCVHAEQRAIMDALRRNPEKFPGSRLYFIRVDEAGEPIGAAGKPYCTVCSKMTLDVGIAEFALQQEDGVAVYDTGEYNELSFAYQG